MLSGSIARAHTVYLNAPAASGSVPLLNIGGNVTIGSQTISRANPGPITFNNVQRIAGTVQVYLYDTPGSPSTISFAGAASTSMVIGKKVVCTVLQFQFFIPICIVE